MSELFVVEVKENTLLTHDGNSQLGIFHMSMEKFLSMSKVNYQKTYWIPDSVDKRYKTISYQKHLSAASIGTKTD